MTIFTGERMARAIWSYLCEPGDPVQQLLAGGAEQALDDLASGRLNLTIHAERWRMRLAGLEASMLAGHFPDGADYLIPGDEHWPASLDDLGDLAPIGLWVRGDSGILTMPGISIVGARAATGYGVEIATRFSAALCSSHVLISGGAYGIDAAVHRTALSRRGRTIVVTAGGIDRIYPTSHRDLVETIIVAGGALISEQPHGAAPARHRFLSRNRIIAALGRTTVVVEAALRSGALATARRAAEIGRDVCAVPGPVTSLASSGTNQLLRDFGICVTSPEDVLELLGSIEPDQLPATPDSSYDRLPERDKKVWNALEPASIRSLPGVARDAGLTASETVSSLEFLRSIGMARSIAGRWTRVAV